MDEIPFGINGYRLARSNQNDRGYILLCIRESILSSVTNDERNLSGLWVKDIMDIVEKNLDGKAMESETFILMNSENKRSGMLWMGRSKDQFTCDDTGYLLGIFVEKNLRGRGLGRSLLEAGEIWCKDKGLVTMTMNVGSENIIATDLYESSGYEPQSIVMRRTLL
jgi:ribosomal protein S18 acetylase RimI-like enzyme